MNLQTKHARGTETDKHGGERGQSRSQNDYILLRGLGVRKEGQPGFLG